MLAAKKYISREVINSNLSILISIFAVIIIFGAIFVPNFLQMSNIINVLRLAAIMGIIAIGESFVLLIGEIDLSIGSILSVSVITGGLFLSVNSGLALIITILIGVAIGILNGVAVAQFKINSLMMTLGGLTLYAGLANIIGRGQAIYLYEQPYISGWVREIFLVYLFP